MLIPISVHHELGKWRVYIDRINLELSSEPFKSLEPVAVKVYGSASFFYKLASSPRFTTYTHLLPTILTHIFVFDMTQNSMAINFECQNRDLSN